ncbi:hypothetical protein TREMEDRAFT_72160 [Tremella mesenterica DSM 1558]|uniref:uncharacterized protein n=1 Tax=Tremella mesenterica (strain ATCC 24925 / CBS 8224 / DSM 1558 / NBRC 9311 / NRRL Y-6157 / RJB 2259-6 / UBC 559-6) TaxID=578456 RepID=UPI0003F4A02A|nr:uncharacterized protein TREMEDRAFT_72160 [Tremella mesenterica DSM 1558]EIW67695.1 hypothetical protein TREMEDRAFT_72160 [Tremella mesenterica DSM 1558]
MSNIASPPDPNGNPLVTVAIAVITVILHLLDLVRRGVAWLTITLPGIVVRMLQYSLTISLGFPALLGLFMSLSVAIVLVIRYRYLTRYTQLKEGALPPPSPTSLSTELLPLATVGLNDTRSRASPFHNYLDDFLAAIRIFGYLEKPVFHELSRYLQTRRLLAGDSVEIGGGDFWCVVEGKVQVFAPSSESGQTSVPQSPDPMAQSPRSTFNGYHLINEVSTGGTISSLFSILSLFTEDIKLAWSSSASTPDGEVEEDGYEDAQAVPLGQGRSKTRTNSDVSHFEMGTSPPRAPSPTEPSPTQNPLRRVRSHSMDSLSTAFAPETDSSVSTIQTSGSTASQPSTTSVSLHSPPAPRTRIHHSLSQPPTPSRTRGSATTAPRAPTQSRPTRSPEKGRPSVDTGSAALKGTIARATVDTTLAVIPAEAFRKLTHKFPKASGTVVQVVLERFSRVTFMTAHKFLGLTKELLRSESSLNKLVSHPLPRSFYTGRGMQALRRRFQPMLSSNSDVPFPSGSTSGAQPSDPEDYFDYVPGSPTVRSPSLPSITPKLRMTPATAKYRILEPEQMGDDEKLDMEKIDTAVATQVKPVVELSPDVAARQSTKFVRRISGLRKQVAAGDLAMSRYDNENDGGMYYKPPPRTPGLPRVDTWRDRFNSSSLDLRGHRGELVDPGINDDDGAFETELKEAVATCIAKSIGLTQPPRSNFDSMGRSSIAPSVSALSTPNSPLFPPQAKGSKVPFGNVLDMMNASSHNDNILGGMLREAAMKVRATEDDASSVSASVQESSTVGPNGTGAEKIMRDLENSIEILHFKKGSTLVDEGETSPGLYYVIDGFLEVSLPIHSTRPTDITSSSGARADHENGLPFGAALGSGDPSSPNRDAETKIDEPLFTVKAGGIAGYLSSLCSVDSYVHITAKTDCFVGFLPHSALHKIIERRPIVLLTLSKRLLSLLSPLVLHIDASLDWMQLGAGQFQYEKGDRSTDFYVVINGRLRSYYDKDGDVHVSREYGQNDSIGELDVITAVSRSDTVHAIRDSELVRIPAALFDAISVQHPATTVQFLRLIAKRVKRAMGEQIGPRTGVTTPPTDVNLRTICVLGTSRSVPVVQFARQLKTSLEDLGASTSYLDQGTVMRHLGRHAFARIGKLKIAGWLADQEQHHRIVLYVADTPPTSQWTLTCIRQADLVLVVAMGDDPTLGEYERLLLASKTTARKELILLHDERTVPLGSTRPWLKNRPWLQAHHHVELPGLVTPHKPAAAHDPAAVAAFKHLRERVEIRLKKYRGLRPAVRLRRPAHMNDFARIARRLCGKQIGLVLGGGGARGISHIGMLQALEEFGIPIDAIGGCSIGAFVGGLYARESDLLETTGRTKQFSGRMGSMWRILSDVTYPYVSYTTGHEFNKAFYNTHIEDFWIPFFANSTNITHSRMEVHRSGYAWRYVRASMTLAGLLPPLSDNGNLLVDGGYMDNTPIGPLRSGGIRDIIVVDVGSVDDTSPRNYGDSVSGWWIFVNKFNPFYQRTVLSMTEVSSRLAYVASVKTLEDVKSDPNCMYLAMPVQQFETLGGFKQFSQVLAVGLEAARNALRQWKDEGRLPSGLVDDIKGQRAIQKAKRTRRMSI